MYKEIDAEIKAFENELFTGHVRFGIEHGDIMSLSVTTKLEPASSYIYDMQKEIERFCADEKDFYGAIEFNFSFGKITELNESIFSFIFQFLENAVLTDNITLMKEILIILKMKMLL